MSGQLLEAVRIPRNHDCDVGSGTVASVIADVVSIECESAATFLTEVGLAYDRPSDFPGAGVSIAPLPRNLSLLFIALWWFVVSCPLRSITHFSTERVPDNLRQKLFFGRRYFTKVQQPQQQEARNGCDT